MIETDTTKMHEGYKKFKFLAWRNEDAENIWAVALCDENNWFVSAMNCIRDSHILDSGKDEEGIYTSYWVGDTIYESESASVRYASLKEVEQYLQRIDIKKDLGEGDIKIFKTPLGSYILFKKYEKSKYVPFDSAEEIKQAEKLNGTYIVKNDTHMCFQIRTIDPDGKYVYGPCNEKLSTMATFINGFTFLNGTPFGKLVED